MSSRDRSGCDEADKQYAAEWKECFHRENSSCEADLYTYMRGDVHAPPRLGYLQEKVSTIKCGSKTTRIDGPANTKCLHDRADVQAAQRASDEIAIRSISVTHFPNNEKSRHIWANEES